jgi:glyoxylase I family protein
MTEFAEHHVAFSVRDVDRSLEFYRYLGFNMCAKWTSADGSLSIAHSKRDGSGFLLEFFCYANNSRSSRLETSTGNDLEALGLKHVGFTVTDLASVREAMVRDGIEVMTDLIHGRTLIDYFFTRDPDGNWVEVLQEERHLDPDNPIIIVEERS